MNVRMMKQDIGRTLQIWPVPIAFDYGRPPCFVRHNKWQLMAVRDGKLDLRHEGSGIHFELGLDHVEGYLSPDFLQLRSQLELIQHMPISSEVRLRPLPRR